MRALSIRQPYAELILRGVKTVEFRSRPTKLVGERFLIYASKSGWKNGTGATRKIWSSDLSPEQPPEWMRRLAETLILSDLPTGVIVGSAIIEKVTAYDPTDGFGYAGLWRWHLRDVQRATTLIEPQGHPQPVWFEAGVG